MIAILGKIKSLITSPFSKTLKIKAAEVLEVANETVEEKVEDIKPIKKPGRPKSVDGVKKTPAKKTTKPKS